MDITATDVLLEQAVLMHLTANYSPVPSERAVARFNEDAIIIALAATLNAGEIPNTDQITAAADQVFEAADRALEENHADGIAAITSQQRAVNAYRLLTQPASVNPDQTLIDL